MHLSSIVAYVAAGLAAIYFIVAPITKRPTLPRWFFALGMLAFGIESLLFGLILQEDNILEVGRLQQFRLVCISFIPGIWLLFSATYSRGDAWSAIKKRGLLLGPALVVPPLIALAFRSGLILLDRQTGPDGEIAWIIQLGWPGYLMHLFLLLGCLGSLIALERTFRASVGTMRWKIKYMLFGLGLLFAVRFFTSSQAILFQSLDVSLEALNSAALLFACLLISRSMARPGSFDLNLYPSQSVLSNSLTIILAGLYLTIVGILSKLVEWFGAEGSFALKAFFILAAIVVLGIGLQSDRLRRKVRTFVSQHFQRPLYDYQKVWLRFSEGLSAHVESEPLCRTIVSLVSETFQALSVSAWIPASAENKARLAASTAQKEIHPADASEREIDATEAIRYFKKNDLPVDIDESSEPWAETLRKANRRQFPKEGGNRIAVPMLSGNSFAGLLVIGDRVSGAKFATQEFNMMKSVAAHAAAALQNARLSAKLAESKELEAFQTIATFFVHDLKNATSTLNLMLKNMPVHWDNPEFRSDALRGIEKTTTRIQSLIDKLSHVRDELELAKRPASAQALIRKSLEQWSCPPNIEFASGPVDDAELEIDDEKAQSVILNLLINAAEAIGDSPGTISLSAKKEENWFVLSISDDGPGMSQAFLRESLFKPFQTTKKTGIGVGMFQCKMIMEAHGGSIAAESEEGKGATFHLRFPLPEGETGGPRKLLA